MAQVETAFKRRKAEDGSVDRNGTSSRLGRAEVSASQVTSEELTEEVERAVTETVIADALKRAGE